MRDVVRGILRLLAQACADLGHVFRPLEILFRVFRSELLLVEVKARGRSCAIGVGSQVIHGESMRFGDRVTIGPYARLETIPSYAGVYLAPALVIEDGVSIGWFAHVACADSVRIGQDTLMAGSVFISDHNHGFSNPESFGARPADTPLEISPVSIGKRCWIGEHVSILPGVTVGDDCVIGAGSVVTHDIPAGSIAVGVPARPIKSRDELGKWLALSTSTV